MLMPDGTRTIITLARGDLPASLFKAAVQELCTQAGTFGVAILDTDNSQAEIPGNAIIHVYTSGVLWLRDDWLGLSESLGLALVHYRRIAPQKVFL
jgi:hypothetical protein